MPIFNAGTPCPAIINGYIKSRIKAPVVGSQVSTLGGVARSSIIIKISLDPKSKWYNGIYENSRYAMWHLGVKYTLSYLLRHNRVLYYQLSRLVGGLRCLRACTSKLEVCS